MDNSGQRLQSSVIPLTVGAVLLSPAVMWKERVDMILVDPAGMLDS